MTKERITDTIINFCEGMDEPVSIQKDTFGTIQIWGSDCNQEQWKNVKEVVSRFMDHNEENWKNKNIVTSYSTVETGPHKTLLITVM